MGENGRKKKELQFSDDAIRAMSTEDGIAFFKARIQLDVEACSPFFARVVAQLPNGGKPDEPQTYEDMKFQGEFLPLVRAFGRVEKSISQNQKLDGVEFDFTEISAKAMSEFLRAARNNDQRAIVEGLTQIVHSCPWGNPRNADTFLKETRYLDEFIPLINDVSEALKKIEVG